MSGTSSTRPFWTNCPRVSRICSHPGTASPSCGLKFPGGSNATNLPQRLEDGILVGNHGCAWTVCGLSDHQVQRALAWSANQLTMSIAAFMLVPSIGSCGASPTAHWTSCSTIARRGT